MKAYQTFGLTLCAIGVTAALTQATPIPPVSPAPIGDRVTAEDRAIPSYKHLFVIIAENKVYEQIIGSPKAPRLNQLAKTYGLASRFYGEIHPSEGNYAAMLGGSNFGIHDDDAFYCQAGSTDQFCSHAKRPNYANHTIAAKSLMDQFTEKGLTWKGYFEDLPSPGSKVVVYPDVKRALYAVKHNGFMNYKSVQDDPQIAQKIVGFDQLATDLKTGNLPNYSHIILNQCNEMHGLEECPNTEKLIQQGDVEIGKLVDRIMASTIWAAPENSAIVITFDEDNYALSNKPEDQGCCGFEPESETNYGGGHIATIVITNHGPRGVVDATPYNHYSLLRTTEDAFGIAEYLKAAGDTDKGVKPMTKLFATPNHQP
jgi:phosphatidylinositol-3-phosphatase